MELHLYTIYDAKAGAYLPPFTSLNDATAIREFETAISQQDHDFNRHSEDYSLWTVATFNQAKAELVTLKHLCIAQAHELLATMERGLS